MSSSVGGSIAPARRSARGWIALGAAWLLVIAPLVWGVLATARKAAMLFG